MPETVLLLHGQPGRAGDWDPLRGALGSAVEVLVPDRPGWDGSAAATDLPRNARAAVQALDAQGARHAVVVGHSLGGAVAAWLAAFHPRRVAGLVLVAPSANVASLYRVDRVLAARGVGSLLSAASLAGVGAALKFRPVRRRIGATWGLDERYLRASAEMLLSPTAWRSFVVEQRALVRDLPLLESRLGAISAPTRIVVGSGDRVVPLESAARLAEQIPAADLVVLDGAGHLLAQQQPRRLAELILEVAGVPVGRPHG